MRGAHARRSLDAMPSTRAQTGPEEWANAASHAAGVLVVFAVWPWLTAVAHRQAGTAGVLAMTVFAFTLVLQYAASAVYHATPRGRAKLWARAVDHAAIYLLIAGSATPFAVGVVGGQVGLLTGALIWVLALTGAWLKLMRRLTGRRMSTGLYVLFGWLAAVLLWPDLRHVDATALAWLVGGGLAYMVGAGFFVFDASLRFGHFIWHLFALAGSSCHVCAAIWPGL
jgi:hemolysin III